MFHGFDDFDYLLVRTCQIKKFVIALLQKKKDVEIILNSPIHKVICILANPNS